MERSFVINNEYLIIPVDENAAESTVYIKDNNDVFMDLKLRLSKTPALNTFLNVSKYKGQCLTLLCGDNADCNLDVIYQSDKKPNDGHYFEALRPKQHFTTKIGWINDPNGLAYTNGVYHLFYQHNPYETRWGNMHWGHSTSIDLIHWTEHDEALYPDRAGTMFSGCAVYDRENLSKLGTAEKPPLLLFYTAAGGTSEISVGIGFTICIAYSLDGGKTFSKYLSNPILATYVPGNRDPKITYHEESKRYIMSLFLDAHRFAFFSSADLIHWRYESEDSFPTLNECPDLFKLDGSDKWVMLAGADQWIEGSVGKYYIGTFDGKQFIKESEAIPIDLGNNFYSLQTFDNEKYNRRILMGWRTRNFFEKSCYGLPFNGEYSIPTVMTKGEIDGQTIIKRYPIDEFFVQKSLEKLQISQTTKDNECIFHGIDGNCFYLKTEFKLDKDSVINFDFGGNSVTYDSKREVLNFLGKEINIPMVNTCLKLLVICDVTSIELYVHDGLYVASNYYEPHNNNNAATVQGKVEVKHLELHKLASIWE